MPDTALPDLRRLSDRQLEDLSKIVNLPPVYREQIQSIRRSRALAAQSRPPAVDLETEAAQAEQEAAAMRRADAIRQGQAAAAAQEVASGRPIEYAQTPEDLTSAAIRTAFPRTGPVPVQTTIPEPPVQRRAEEQRPPEPPGMMDIMRQYLGTPSPGGGGAPGVRIAKEPYENPEEYKKRAMAELPEERKAQPTYKADQGMALLETGLKILAAQPKLGQNALSQIAGPIGEGVKEYRGEREKQRLSEAEEAKAAREDKMRMAGVKREIENAAFERDKAGKTYSLEVDKLREMQRHNASTESLQAQSQKVAMAGVLVQSASVDLQRSQLNANLARQPAAVIRRLEDSGLLNDLAALQAKSQSGRLSQEERTRLVGLELRLALETGTFSAHLRAQTGADSTDMRAVTALMQEGRAKMASGDEQGANAAFARANALLMRITGQGPGEVPELPLTRIPPR
jgi:hypothetical protein